VFALVVACIGVEGFVVVSNRVGRDARVCRYLGKEVTGSFFNPVPEKGDDSDGDNGKEEEGEEGDVMDRSIADLMRSRRAKPRASNPSTVGGVPTSKATGTLRLTDNNCNNTTLTQHLTAVHFTRF